MDAQTLCGETCGIPCGPCSVASTITKANFFGKKKNYVHSPGRSTIWVSTLKVVEVFFTKSGGWLQNWMIDSTQTIYLPENKHVPPKIQTYSKNRRRPSGLGIGKFSGFLAHLFLRNIQTQNLVVFFRFHIRFNNET